MSIKQSERYKWVDIARGIGILLVVYAHAYPPTGIKILIYSFHIPLFFVLSGYCFKYADNIDFVTFIKKKFYSLIIPYIFLSAICIVLYFILSQFANNSYNYWKLILGIFIGIRGQEWMPVNTPMWFILALFVTNLIGFIVFKIAKKDSIRILLLTLVGVVGYAYVIKIGYRLPWGIDAAMVGSIFFGGGIQLEKMIYSQNYKTVNIGIQYYLHQDSYSYCQHFLMDISTCLNLFMEI